MIQIFNIMIKRIVKMSFKEGEISAFIANFKANKNHIKAFEGCQHVELLQDKSTPNIFFTFSIWDRPEALENYRHSELFRGIWAKTKPMFNAKPEAWSLDLIG